MTIGLVTQGVICSQAIKLITSATIIGELETCCDTNSFDCIFPVTYKRANPLDLRFIVQQNGIKVPTTDLENATEITFVVKTSKFNNDIDADILKLKTLGEVIVLPNNPDPNEPNLSVPLSATDMSIDAGQYYMGICIAFASGDKTELNLTVGDCSFESVSVIQDIVRC